jgi:RES domain-containing protein
MISSWRIVKARHAASAFSGDGARLVGGRWNSKGTAVVYTAGSESLAILEMLVHLGAGAALDSYVLIGCEFDEALATSVDVTALPTAWRAFPSAPELAAIGDAWVNGGLSPVLRVPSAIVPSEANYLLNPQHPEFKKLRIVAPSPFSFEARLIRP